MSTPTGAVTAPTGPSSNKVQLTRAWTGLIVVVGGDVAIAVAAILATVKFSGQNAMTSDPIVAILTSAFTAISTMTTAYFGIRSMSNTAQSVSDNSSAQTTTTTT
jgi:hypothetical protein